MSIPQPPMKNLSVSKIESYLKCPLSFKYRYVDKIPETSSGVLTAGRVVHEIVEHALKEFSKHERYPDWQTLDDMYNPTWERHIKDEESKESFVGWQYNADEPAEKLRASYRPLVRLARQDALEKVRPWMIGNDPVVEYRIDLELDSEVGPFKILGYIDLLDASGILMDWKSTHKVSKAAKEGWLQFSAYSIHVWPLIGDEVVNCKKVFLVRGDNPHVEYGDFSVTPRHREWFVKLAAQVWKSIVHGAYPGRTGGWWCSPKFCSFHGPCLDGIYVPEPEPEPKEKCVTCGK